MSDGYARYGDKLIEQVHDAVKEQGQLLIHQAELLTRVSVLGESAQKDIVNLWNAHNELVNRTTALEKWRSYIVGAYSAVIIGIGAAWHWMSGGK